MNLLTFARKHSNLLFAIGEIALTTGAVTFAIKNTNDYICTEHSQEEPKEKAKKIAKHYWPTMIFFSGFVALRSVDAIYNHELKMEYTKALLAAQSALLAGKKKITEVQTSDAQNENLPVPSGEDQANWDYVYFFDPDDIPEAMELSTNCIGREDANLDIFYIPSLGVLFRDDLYHVRQAEEYCARWVEEGKDLFVNDMMKLLGLGSISMGKELYFEGDPSSGVDKGFIFDLAPAMTDDDNPILFFTINPNRSLKSIYEFA